MVKTDNTNIDARITEFRMNYAARLRALMEALDEAHISHYSSGIGHKSITFNLFPASAHIRELISMVSLDRAYKDTAHGGFKDAAAAELSNPVYSFIHFLKRWSLFAEQVMQNEGISPRGIAAGRAKIMMNELMEKLQAELPLPVKPGKKASAGAQGSGLFALMQDIGLVLEARAAVEKSAKKANIKTISDANYHKALAAAKISRPDFFGYTQAA